MSNICIILGKSGTGKSTSLRTLNSKETVILSPLGKKLPFKEASKMYNEKNKNHFQIDTYTKIISYLDNISSSAKHVKNIVIDDAIYIMRKEFFERSKETGYTKFADIGHHFQMIVAKCEKCRSDLNIFLVLHAEEIYNDNAICGYKAATIGKMIDDKYDPLHVVTILLFSDIIFDENGAPTYGFYTKTQMKGTAVIPAKTPDGMFEESFIPNDLQVVVNAMEAYF